jgi:hypothetical protein
MIITYRELGIILAALLVAACYWLLGAVLLFLFFVLSVSTVSFVWLSLFRPVFYLPAVLIVVYLFVFRKKKGLFLESLMFFLALSLAVFWTLELIVFI